MIKPIFLNIIFLLWISFFTLGTSWVQAGSSDNIYPETYRIVKTVFIPWGNGKNALSYRESLQKGRDGKDYLYRSGPSYLKVDDSYVYISGRGRLVKKFDYNGKELARGTYPFSGEIIKATKGLLIGMLAYEQKVFYMNSDLSQIKTFDIPRNIELSSAIVEAGVLFPGRFDKKANCKYYVYDQEAYKKYFGDKLPANKKSIIIKRKKVGARLLNLPDIPNRIVESNEPCLSWVGRASLGFDKRGNIYYQFSNGSNVTRIMDSVVIKLSPRGKVLAKIEFPVGDEYLTKYLSSDGFPIDVDDKGNIYRMRSTSAGVFVERWFSNNP